ncbi:hypothetical protein F3Y22_tig00000340pilonHSYRG00276 [Hibiscus syriacus]|uniref:VIN3-like fibronectin type-III domain-containing protein n=1 Tax=Hibiscus syriacus TaxID=106335 RepID=A0A6A3D0N1_HIBSY|nr:hypothetical protein F3Y22_tig00000340pilonHSYRG00276 [Hibiscus syriacus]
MQLDGSYCCASCGKVSVYLGKCWKKQLSIAKDARRLDQASVAGDIHKLCSLAIEKRMAETLTLTQSARFTSCCLQSRDKTRTKEPVCVFPRTQRRISIANLQPCTEYTFRIVSYTEAGDLGHSEANCFTKSVEIIHRNPNSTVVMNHKDNALTEGSSSGSKELTEEDSSVFSTDINKCREASKIVKPETQEDDHGHLFCAMEAYDDAASHGIEKNGLARSHGSGDSQTCTNGPTGKCLLLIPMMLCRKRAANSNEEARDCDSALINGSPFQSPIILLPWRRPSSPVIPKIVILFSSDNLTPDRSTNFNLGVYGNRVPRFTSKIVLVDNDDNNTGFVIFGKICAPPKKIKSRSGRTSKPEEDKALSTLTSNYTTGLDKGRSISFTRQIREISNESFGTCQMGICFAIWLQSRALFNCLKFKVISRRGVYSKKCASISSSDSAKAPGPDGFTMGFYKKHRLLEETRAAGVVFKVDFSRAYDTVDWQILSHARLQVGNGNSISFGKIHGGDFPLKVLFPRIFALSTNQGLNVIKNESLEDCMLWVGAGEGCIPLKLARNLSTQWMRITLGELKKGGSLRGGLSMPLCNQAEDQFSICLFTASFPGPFSNVEVYSGGCFMVDLKMRNEIVFEEASWTHPHCFSQSASLDSNRPVVYWSPPPVDFLSLTWMEQLVGVVSRNWGILRLESD